MRAALGVAGLVALVSCARPLTVDRARTVRVTLRSPRAHDPHARVAVYWLDAADAARADQHGLDFKSGLRALERLRAVDAPDLARGKTIALELPPGAVVYAIADERHQILRALFGEGGAGDLVGHVAADRRAVELLLRDAIPARDDTSRCVAPDRMETLPSPVPGPATTRHLCVHLPAGYDASPDRRYPTIYVLPGLFGREDTGSIRRVFEVLDRLGAPILAVGVDTSDPDGSSYLAASPRTGDFDGFFARDVLELVDTRYRTIAQPESRGLVGQSTGGFNAVSFGLRHPERFGAIAASSPDGLDLASWLTISDGASLSAVGLTFLRVEAAFGPPGQLSSYAADWSPDPHAPFGLAWPADPTTGRVRPDVLGRWIAHSPTSILRAHHAEIRARFSGKVYLAVGMHDEFGLFEPTRRFSVELEMAGVANTFAPDDGGHGASVERVEGMVRALARSLNAR